MVVVLVVVVGRTVVVVVGGVGRGSCEAGIEPDASMTGMGLDVGHVRRTTATDPSSAPKEMTAVPLMTLTPGTPALAGILVMALRSRVTYGRQG